MIRGDLQRIGGSVLLVGLAALVATVSAFAMTFADPVGDAIPFPEGADVSSLPPTDITAIEVTNSRSVVTLKTSLASQTLAPVAGVIFALDLDKNRNTGDEGTDALLGYVVEPQASGLLFTRWNGSELVDVTETSATATFSGGVVTITASRSELLNTRGFEFFALALAATPDASQGSFDFAPEPSAAGVFLVYDLEGLPPPPPPKLTAVGLAGKPLPPKAGKRFVVSTVVTRSDTESIVTEGRVTCTARVGERKIRASGRLVSLRAQCAMTIPKGTKGKRLLGTMTVQSGGGVLRKPFTFRVG